MDKSAKQEFVVLQKAYDLVVDLIPRIHKFPRDHKFTLGDRIENAGLDALMALVEARWRKDRAGLLDSANAQFDRLRYLLRLATDFGLLPFAIQTLLATKVNEVGRLVGAWRKRGESAA